MNECISPADYVLLQSARNGNGESLFQAAQKGVSYNAINNATKIFCDNVVSAALAACSTSKTLPESRLLDGVKYLKKIACLGLSQETKDYILFAYLSVGIIECSLKVAKFGASKEALSKLKEALIKNGDPRGLNEVVELQGLQLEPLEIYELVRVCIEKYSKYNIHIVIEALNFGAPNELREKAARKFMEENILPSSKGGYTLRLNLERLFEILEKMSAIPKDILDSVVKIISNEIANKKNEYDSLTYCIELGYKYVKLGPSAHIADLFAQEMKARGKDEVIISPIAHRCTFMLVESWAESILEKVKRRRIDMQHGCWTGSLERYKSDNVAILAKLAQIAKFASDELATRVIDELTNNNLVDMAIELVAYKKSGFCNQQ